MKRRICSVLLVGLMAIITPTMGRASAAPAADEPTHGGTITYTIDPVAGMVHVRMERTFVNTDLSTRRGHSLCYASTYFPVPSGVTNFRSVHQYPGRSRPEPGVVKVRTYEGHPEAIILDVEIMPCVIYGIRAYHTTITYDIPRLPDTAAHPSPFDPAYFAFEMYAIGSPGGYSYTIIAPDTYSIDSLGPEWQRSTMAGSVIYSLPALDDPSDYGAFVEARDDTKLISEAVTVAGYGDFELRGWSNDAAWPAAARAVITDGIPALSDAIGVPSPITGPVQVREAFAANGFNPDAWSATDPTEIELNCCSSPQAALHELTHLWFNSGSLEQRWLSEGLAQLYSNLAVTSVGGEAYDPLPINPDDANGFRLNDWVSPEHLSEFTSVRETYGLNGAYYVMKSIADEIGADFATALVSADQRAETGIRAQRERVAQLMQKLAASRHPRATELASLAEWLIRRSVWIIGGDGWAYDIGYGGLDHVLALSYDVNILVLDTEVYSNTGGQTSKATPVGAVAKFSAGGKTTAKKDLARIASDYGHVYVATVAYGAKDVHTLKAFHEAESHDGPSLIVAYSPCIAHGVDMLYNQRQQEMAVKTGHWPLFRFDPRLADSGANPFKLDSAPPSQPIKAFMDSETRFAMLARSHPEAAERLAAAAQDEADRRYKAYQALAAAHADIPKAGA